MLDIWNGLTTSLRDLIAAYPLAAGTLILFFEELGVPSPVPSDVMMLLAGLRARQGLYSYWFVIVVEEIATVCGTTGLYFFSRRFGRAIASRYGWLFHLGPDTLARAERAIARSGGRAIVIGRIIPGLRIITPIAAGVLGVPLRTFLPAVALGALIYIAAFTALGALAGPLALGLVERLALPIGAIASLAVAALAVVLVRRIKAAAIAAGVSGPRRVVAARIDGLLAGVVALLATNGVLGILDFLTRFSASTPRLLAGEPRSGLHLLLGWPAFIAIAGLLGVIDEWFGAERLPARRRIFLTAGAPLLLTLLVVLVVTRSDATGPHGAAAGVLVLTEMLRWTAFGIALGELLGLDATVHQLPTTQPEKQASSEYVAGR